MDVSFLICSTEFAGRKSTKLGLSKCLPHGKVTWTSQDTLGCSWWWRSKLQETNTTPEFPMAENHKGGFIARVSRLSSVRDTIPHISLRPSLLFEEAEGKSCRKSGISNKDTGLEIMSCLLTAMGSNLLHGPPTATVVQEVWLYGQKVKSCTYLQKSIQD